MNNINYYYNNSKSHLTNCLSKKCELILKLRVNSLIYKNKNSSKMFIAFRDKLLRIKMAEKKLVKTQC